MNTTLLITCMGIGAVVIAIGFFINKKVKPDNFTKAKENNNELLQQLKNKSGGTIFVTDIYLDNTSISSLSPTLGHAYSSQDIEDFSEAMLVAYEAQFDAAPDIDELEFSLQASMMHEHFNNEDSMKTKIDLSDMENFIEGMLKKFDRAKQNNKRKSITTQPTSINDDLSDLFAEAQMNASKIQDEIDEEISKIEE